MLFKLNVRFALVPLTVIMLTGCATEPVAFFAIPSSAGVNVPVECKNYSVDADSYLWDFGDGTTSTEANPTHYYTEGSTYTVSLTAFAKGGKKKDVASRTIIIDAVQAFLGSYNVTQSCNSGNSNYPISVLDGGTNSLLLFNFTSLGLTLNANIIGGDSIVIPLQTYINYQIAGTGNLNGSVLTINYTLNDGFATDNCTVTAIKQ